MLFFVRNGPRSFFVKNGPRSFFVKNGPRSFFVKNGPRSFFVESCFWFFYRVLNLDTLIRIVSILAILIENRPELFYIK